MELFDDWEAVAGAADGTLDHGRLFERLSWFRLLAAHCPPAGRFLAARAAGTWLFLARRGRRAEAYANWYSLRFGPAGGSAGLEAIGRRLRAEGVVRLSLSPIEDPGATVGALRRAGWIARTQPATASWQIDVGDLDFATYWARRPSRLRNTAERRAKQLDVEIHRHFDAGAWAAYEEVYQASWKPAEGSPAFLRALAVQERDRLRLGIARHDGRPVAAQLWLVEDGRATIHKLAYREDAARLAPGTVLSMAMFRAAIDQDGVARIDYGTGDEAYKADWMDERHILWRIDAFDPRRPSGLLAAARATASTLVARFRRR
ncbi:GNAT family N-acetyltransferase [Sphingomonas parva]|uniref:GNAT family N-acetyltransferase n=1 Tax=Sphingomonas parva TaxID=2555898 RepID=UPI001CDC58D3|nr:GNAT family N-acetyltransferase [Sphingomonas parva]